MDRIQYRQTYCLKQGFLSCGFQAVHNVHFLCRKTHRAASQNPQPGDKSAQNNSPEYCWSFPQKDFPVLRSHPRIHDQIHEEKASPALGMSQDFFHYKHCGRLYNKPALPHGHLLWWKILHGYPDSMDLLHNSQDRNKHRTVLQRMHTSPAFHPMFWNGKLLFCCHRKSSECYFGHRSEQGTLRHFPLWAQMVPGFYPRIQKMPAGNLRSDNMGFLSDRRSIGIR